MIYIKIACYEGYAHENVGYVSQTIFLVFYHIFIYDRHNCQAMIQISDHIPLSHVCALMKIHQQEI